MNLQLTAPDKAVATIELPTSKSVSNRALLISALCGDAAHVSRLALCDDTMVMMEALKHHSGEINVGGAGTAMRFLTAYFATLDGSVTILDGVERMRQRPIGPLVDALRSLGARIDYLDREGYPPLRVSGTKLSGGEVVLPGGVSSQFTSALMMILPVVGGGRIRLTGDVVSASYLNMTVEVMRRFGATVDISDYGIIVGDGYTGGELIVEGDWSAAVPWYAIAALLQQSSITLQGLIQDSIQGDARLVELGSKLGIVSRFDSSGVTLDTSQVINCCCSTFADMSATPDLAMSWAVLMCLLERSFRMTGLRTLHLKESDRLEALRQGLLQLGYVLKVESEDAISWYGERVALARATPWIESLGDHRVAMAFAPAAVRFPGLVIGDAEVVSKSYPAFWRHLEKSGFTVRELAQ